MSICFLIVNAAEIGKEITNLKIKSINIADFLNTKKKRLHPLMLSCKWRRKLSSFRRKAWEKNDTTDVQYNVVNKALKNR